MAISAARRLESIGTSIFTEMTALATQHKAINLSQGFPDFAAPDFIKAAARQAIDADFNQYAPSTGLPMLRAAISRSWQTHYGRTPDSDTEITVTSGATEALLVCALAFINPGDEVVVFEPTYDAYPPDTRMAGGIPRFVRLREPTWDIPVEELKSAITARTRVIIVNTPLNPAGKVFRKDELELIASLANQHDLLVITDEVYERLVYPGAVHLPLATLPGMWERTVTVSSTGKPMSVTGWKIGYVVANPVLTDAVRRVHQFCTFASATPLQAAVVKGFEAGAPFEREVHQFYHARRGEMVDALVQAGFVVRPPEGTYFVMADYRKIADEDDVTFCRRMVHEAGVAAIPTSAFYHDGYQSGLIRFCFAKKPGTLKEAAERLRRWRK